jgi:hypothetical protein
MDLSKTEQAFLEMFSALPEEGKRRVFELMDYLLQESEGEEYDQALREARRKLQSMTREELLERLRKADEDVKAGHFFTGEDIDREIENWD